MTMMVSVKRYMKRTDDVKRDNIFVTEYPSIGDFVTDINSLPLNQYSKDREQSSQKKEDNDNGWYMSRDYAYAEHLFTHGWDTAAEKMAQKVKLTVATPQPVRTSKPAFGVVGSQASVPRYLQGIPTSMVSRQITYSKQKVVTITKGISYSGWWTSQAILEESIKALQIIQSLESAGKRVRLNVMVATTKGNKHSICKVCVKQPDERLNISKMSFALAHPSMLRRFFFKWIEVDPFRTFDLGYGYGAPSSASIRKLAMDENEYYIPEKIADVDQTIKDIEAGKII